MCIAPLKFLAIAQFARGRIGFGLIILLFAKSLGLGATAFLFDLCRDKLPRMAWFAKPYATVMRAPGRLISWRRRARPREPRAQIWRGLAASPGSGGSRFFRGLTRVRAATARELAARRAGARSSWQ